MSYKNKEEQREYQRVWMANRRANFIAKHGGKCCICDSTEQLEFDHIDREQKTSHRIWSWKEERIEEELKKCRLVCRACHTVKSIEEQNYPERHHGTELMYQKAKCRCQPCKTAHAACAADYRRRKGRKRYSTKKPETETSTTAVLEE